MRSMALRACAGVFALSWFVLPGFGVIDLTVTWDPDWPQVLEAGWGLFSTLVVGAAFVLVAVRPRATPAALVQLLVAALALGVSAAAAREPRLFSFVVGLALEVAIVRLLFGGASFAARLSRPLLLLGLLGAGPWLAYALQMWAANRESRPDSDFTVGIDHYSVQGALGLALAVLPLVAALQPRMRRFTPACAGVAALYLAIVSLAWPDAAAGLTTFWSVAAGAWGLALLATAAR